MSDEATSDIVDVIPGAEIVKAGWIRVGDFTFDAFGNPHEVRQVWPGKETVSIGHVGWKGASVTWRRDDEVTIITAATMARRSPVSKPDTWSSASRQHYIDTGEYLPAD